MKKQTGRKAIILLTDGEDNGSKVTLVEAVSSAQHADTLAYSIRVADQEENFQGFPGGGMGRRGGWGGRGGGYGRGPRMEQRPEDSSEREPEDVTVQARDGYYAGTSGSELPAGTLKRAPH